MVLAASKQVQNAYGNHLVIMDEKSHESYVETSNQEGSRSVSLDKKFQYLKSNEISPETKTQNT